VGTTKKSFIFLLAKWQKPQSVKVIFGHLLQHSIFIILVISILLSSRRLVVQPAGLSTFNSVHSGAVSSGGVPFLDSAIAASFHLNPFK
jgi:hypothetical protein